MENTGIATIVLTPIPEFNREVGFPRVAAIAYPFGRPVGDVGDRSGQRQVLLKTLACLEKADEPGQVFHLPFEWPETPKAVKWHPPEMSPIIKLHLNEIKKAAVARNKKK